jgi:hypothetical protein
MLAKNLLAVACVSLFSSLLMAQSGHTDYEAAWKKIDSLLLQKGLTRSALQRADKLYAAAKKEKNDAQLIRTLIYRMSLGNMISEDSVQKNILELENEIAGATQPAQSILTSLLAQTYLNYFQQNRWQLYGRMATLSFAKKEVTTWGVDDFRKKIGELFLVSIEQKKLLQKTRLESFDPVIIKGTMRYLRPTLFDLLAHQALNYFKSDEPDINRPAYRFEIDDPQMFAEAPIFAAHHFPSADSLSLHFQALRIFQELILAHVMDAQPDALLDLDVERLQFAYTYGVMQDKDSLYMRALSTLTDRFGAIPGADQAWYLQAQQYANRAAKYDPLGDTADRYAYRQAAAICTKVISGKDSSEGISNCRILLKNIFHKQLTLETERINSPGQPFRSLLSWRNFSQVHFRLIRIEHSLYESIGDNSWQDEAWKELLQLPVFRAFSQALPETGDYQLHRTEIKIDGLPAGKYALVASVGEDFGLGRNVLAVQYVYVSSIAYFNYDRDYFVVNRETGLPIAGASVQAWLRFNDQAAGKQQLSNLGAYKTDQHGHFLLSKTGFTHDSRTQMLEITTAGDHLFLDEPLNENYNQEEETDNNDAFARITYEKDNLNSFLFTDRSIYRPGQTVYFKGIVVTRDFHSKQPRKLPQFRTKLILYNVNSEKVDSLELITNEYGSYYGSFRLPEHLLNGEFRIEDDSTAGQKEFSVEEYKRPKFYADYEPLKTGYLLGDSIHVRGSARAYAGNTVDGAKVKFRVVRNTQFPYPWLFSRGRNYRRGEQEISHGEAVSRADGSFVIDFMALPDRSVERSQNPVFAYTVSADVTDINGETRSATTVLRIGYSALQLSIDLPSGGHLPADSLKEILVSGTNLAGEPEAARVHINIYSLKAPDRLIRGRYWTEPDQFVMNRQEYLISFPHDEYSNETHQANWERTGKVFELTDSADKKEKINLSPGWYSIEARATDRYGQEVTYQTNFDLYDSKTGEPASPQYNWVVDEGQALEPGNTTMIRMGSSVTDLFVIRQVTKPLANAFQFFSPEKGKYTYPYPVTEADRGGFRVSDVFIKDNRFYTQSHVVRVPWSNKELSIHYTRFRDKTLPGSREKWAMNISGYKGEKVNAEVLAGMYDASLDQFNSHNWTIPDLYQENQSEIDWSGTANFSNAQSQDRYLDDNDFTYYEKTYDRLLLSPTDTYTSSGEMYVNATRMKFARADTEIEYDKVETKDKAFASPAIIIDGDGTKKTPAAGRGIPEELAKPMAPVSVRRNMQETAFFLPDLRTDSAGNVSFSFTMPEALTTWKWMVLAHTKDLAFGYAERSVITQKELMVQPNAPRFLREGDHMELSVKIVNLTDSEMTGQAELQLIDPTSNQSADGWFSNRQANQFFTVAARQSTSVSFPIEIPFQYNRPLTYKITASAGNYSDGEEATLPVVSNRMLVTESMPLNLQGNGSRSFQFDKLLRSGGSETLSQHALTVEFTSNPVWYAVQALPYLMEYPYACAEQTFNRFYANALATRIVNSSPRIKMFFEKWKTSDTAALLSNLEKNQELKSVLLEETPWVMEAKSESQQKKNIALLFDMVRMSSELESAINKLKEMQSSDGGFPWFKGGPDDRYITQYILTGIGRLEKLGAMPDGFVEKAKPLVDAAIHYADQEVKQDYERLKKQIKQGTVQPGVDRLVIQYLYMRSFFSGYGIPGDVFGAVNAYRKQLQQNWLQQNKYMQGMIALALFRTGDIQTAKDIMASLRQNAIQDDELGMYWKEMSGSFYWFAAPIETQSLLIEAFREISPNAVVDRQLKTWLLKQKQTRSWPTTKATADACYALMIGGADWLSDERTVTIKLGDKMVSSSGDAGVDTGGLAAAEAGTGYLKKVFDGAFVNPSMGNIGVTVSGPAVGGSVAKGAVAGGPAWGAVYWQYFENLDRIVPPAGDKAPLRLSKQLFIEKNTDKGPVLEPVSANGDLKQGDKLKIRIELHSDRDLEYVHMKDMRASCMEPVNVLSGYKWQDGLGYYESTKDVSTDFFFSSLPRGTYVFEYPVFVSQIGNFSNGVTSIECMYAPKFAFHSEGNRVNVETPTP